jgi:hypothetical protein
MDLAGIRTRAALVRLALADDPVLSGAMLREPAGLCALVLLTTPARQGLPVSPAKSPAVPGLPERSSAAPPARPPEAVRTPALVRFRGLGLSLISVFRPPRAGIITL